MKLYFLSLWGAYINLPFLAVSFQLVVEEKVPAFLNFQIAAGDRSCFNFSNQDGLFTISCSLAALFQTTKMRLPHVASGRGGVLLAGRNGCSTLLSLGYL